MREKICINNGWLFHKGDIETEMPSSRGLSVLASRTEREHFSPASRHYVPVTDKSDNNILYTADLWKSVDLPTISSLMAFRKKNITLHLDICPTTTVGT